ncbi:MAG: DNA methyltransferase [Candidatus Woesearchaeota archaeon]|jgi:DNA modification methylase|nr:DNA methyltransferase [Candidatus Woesearchaeota archaeon]
MSLILNNGTTGVACKNLNRHFIGIEKDEKYFKIAEERISGYDKIQEVEMEVNSEKKTIKEGKLFNL